MANDDSWRDLEGSWDRLRWARRKKFGTAEDAARSIGIKPGTYRAYEREPGKSKHTPLDHQHAIRFAKRLNVRWEWLLLGEGEPHLTGNEGSTFSRMMGLAQKLTADEQAKAADFLEMIVAARTGTHS